MKKLLLLFLLVCITQVNAQIITTVAGTGAIGYSGDGGQATAATLTGPAGVTFDAAGNLYITDTQNSQIRIVTQSGIINREAGSGSVLATGYTGDGGQATDAELYNPLGIEFDNAGNLYFADMANNVIRKINTAGIITTIAGTGIQGYVGNNSPATAARLSTPSDVAIAPNGDIYIADYLNNVVRKVNSVGLISSVIGYGVQGYSGDGGPATAAKIYQPFGLAFDVAGNLYFTDSGNNRIRKVSTAGIITTVAGGGTVALGSSGVPATAVQLSTPIGLCFDATGNLFFSGSNYICKINTSGLLFTVAGNGTQGFSGDGGPAYAAQLRNPNGLAFDASGTLFFADQQNNRVRKFTPCNQPGILSQPVSDSVCEGKNLSFSLQVCTATALQWQVNTGGGFVNVVNSSIYSGANSTALNITAAQASLNGNQYRCIVYDTPNDTSNIVTLTIKPNHTHIVASSAAFCTNTADTLLATGATTYTWTGGSNATTVIAPYPSNQTPVSYTLTGTSNGCTSADHITLSINTPSISITANALGQVSYTYSDTNYAINLCKHSKLSLTASGLLNYKWLPGNDTTALVTKYPSNVITYTVQGYDSHGCFEKSYVKVYVDTMQINFTVLDTPACIGGRVQISAQILHTGSNWNNANWYQNGLNVSYSYPDTVIYPTLTSSLTTFYFTVKMWNSFNCIDSASIIVPAVGGCVWPGDADENLVANNLDLLPIGIEFGATGPPRPISSQYMYWRPWAANNWTDTLVSGVNAKYSDSNGDGVVGLTDTLAVYNNYNQTHAYRLENPQTMQQDTVHDIYFSFSKPVYYAGDTVVADICIGSALHPQNNFYGAAFTLHYDQTKVVSSSEKFYFNNSWVGNINQQKIKMFKWSSTPGFIDASLVRITHTDTTGYGKIATLKFILKANIDRYNLPFTISNQIKINHTGSTSALSAGIDSVFVGPNCSVTLSGNSQICIGQTTTITASGAGSYNWSPGSLIDSSQVLSPSATTNYTVVGSNSYGCLKSNIITVYVNPLPTVSLSLGFTDSICNTITGPQILIGSPPYGTYSGVGIANSYFYPHNLASGAYQLHYNYTDVNGCSGSATDSVHVISCTSAIKQFQNSVNEFTIIPNPSNGNFTVEVSTNEKQTLQLFDVNGKQVLSQTINGTTNIDASNLNAGVYSLSVASKEGVVNKKLVIVK